MQLLNVANKELQCLHVCSFAIGLRGNLQQKAIKYPLFSPLR